MINSNLYFNSGELFSNGYERVVHGERGPYIELNKEQIVCPLKSKFNNNPYNTYTGELITLVPYYYYWLVPESGTMEKVYLQVKTVKYADYKIGYYYISPTLIKEFKEETI
jgi:hypothetical protein